MSGDPTYDLLKPIPDGEGGEIASFTITEPTVGQLKKLNAIKDDFESGITFLAITTGVKRPLLDALGSRDMHGALEAIKAAGFLPADDRA